MQQKLREPGTEETWGLTQETLSLLETEAGPGKAVGSEASDTNTCTEARKRQEEK